MVEPCSSLVASWAECFSVSDMCLCGVTEHLSEVVVRYMRGALCGGWDEPPHADLCKMFRLIEGMLFKSVVALRKVGKRKQRLKA